MKIVTAYIKRCAPQLYCVLLLLTYLIIDHFFHHDREKQSGANAKEAIALMKDWAVWLTTLETGMIGALGFMIKDGRLNNRVKSLATFVLWVLGFSICQLGLLISGLPAKRFRLVDTATETNDFYYDKVLNAVPIRVGCLSGMAQFFFVVGVMSFAILISKTFDMKDDHKLADLKQ